MSCPIGERWLFYFQYGLFLVMMRAVCAYVAGIVGLAFAAHVLSALPREFIPPPQITLPGQPADDSAGAIKSEGGASAARKSPLDILGFWTIPDKDKNNAPESVVYFYVSKDDGRVYCKMIAIYDGDKIVDTLEKPVERAKGISGSPFLCGLDFIFGLEKNGPNRYSGHVVNPDDGSIYRCHVWVDTSSGRLVVRGELLVFGVNEYWDAFDKKDLPFKFNAENLTPNTPFKE